MSVDPFGWACTLLGGHGPFWEGVEVYTTPKVFTPTQLEQIQKIGNVARLRINTEKWTPFPLLAEIAVRHTCQSYDGTRAVLTVYGGLRCVAGRSRELSQREW